ncbi:MAG: hypothetical protein PUD64_01225 [Bacteroidales bacterium]|nr:hypothetical protein [Bacteroidales bacterium]
MTGGGHFRHPGGGGSRAKPGISPTWASATCPEQREHIYNRHPGGGGRPSATDS